MRKIGLAVLAGLTAISLGACGKQETAVPLETSVSEIDKTETVIPEVAVSETATASTSSSESSVQQASSQPQETSEGLETEETSVPNEKRTPQEQELINMLDEINRDGRVGEAGCSLTATKLAAHLMNWGVGTPLTAEQAKTVTTSWLQSQGQSEQSVFAEKLSLVRDSYNLLLGEDAQGLLDEAGVTDAAYPWSDEPIETVEAIMQAVFGE